jgi:hypothetical protein
VAPAAWQVAVPAPLRTQNGQVPVGSQARGPVVPPSQVFPQTAVWRRRLPEGPPDWNACGNPALWGKTRQMCALHCLLHCAIKNHRDMFLPCEPTQTSKPVLRFNQGVLAAGVQPSVHGFVCGSIFNSNITISTSIRVSHTPLQRERGRWSANAGWWRTVCMKHDLAGSDILQSQDEKQYGPLCQSTLSPKLALLRWYQSVISCQCRR